MGWKQGTGIRLLFAILTMKHVEFIENALFTKVMVCWCSCFMMNSGCTKVAAMVSFQLQLCIDLATLLIALDPLLNKSKINCFLRSCKLYS